MTARLRLPREERAEQITSMRDAGLSVQAIASATGHSFHTVLKDTQALQSATPAPVTGIDGKQYSPSQPMKTWPVPERRRSAWSTLALACAVVGLVASVWLLAQAVVADAVWLPAAWLIVVNVFIGGLALRGR